MADGASDPDSYWVRWHEAYEDPASGLSVRLRLVQSALRGALDRAARDRAARDRAGSSGPVRVVSMCAGQGRDVIDVLAAEHGRAAEVSALLVEQDPALVEFARQRAGAAAVGAQVTVVEGDASLASQYVDWVPADVVLVCGVFGNISDRDIARFVALLPSMCAAGGSVIWTRHRKAPDLTPAIREWFGAAAFTEVTFEAPPDPYLLTVGCHRLTTATATASKTATATGPAAGAAAFDPSARLFECVGDGRLPA